MSVALLFVTLIVLLALGVPVAFALLGASLVTLLSLGLPPIVLVQQTVSGAGTVSLIAIPLFIFAGRTDAARRHLGAAHRIRLVPGRARARRPRPGQRAVLAVLRRRLGLGAGRRVRHRRRDDPADGEARLRPRLRRERDHDRGPGRAAGAAVAQPDLYSAAAGGGISIADLFAAGIVPALLLTLVLMATGWLIARRRGYAVETFPGFGAVLRSFVAALPGLLLVALIFVGIRTGVFTAVESAAIAVCYALLVTRFLYRSLGWKEFAHTCLSAARTTGMILFVIASAASFGWLLAYLEVPGAAVGAISTLSTDKNVVLLLMIGSLLVIGTFMDLAPLIIICTPIFLPVAKSIGIDPVHFGVILILKGGIGLVTPPLGSVLFVGTAIGGITVGQAMRTIWPFYFAAFAVLLVVAFVPELSLWLPRLLK
jgi:TRAP-type C4-dicarboxylate transport system permease large subunit